jgi:hypothetical protein
LQEEGKQALQRYYAAAQAAARDLQQATETGSHAAFSVASAAAAKYSTLADVCSACAARFLGRQQAAAQALQASVSALPLAQVQCALDVALELGLPGRDLAAALEAARARDSVAVAKLSAAVKVLYNNSSCILASSSGADVAAPAAAAAGAGPTVGTCSSGDSSGGSSSVEPLFDLARFVDAVAACRQCGKAYEAAAAESVLRDCRQLAAAQLSAAADESPSQLVVHQLLHWCERLGGLEQECVRAVAKLSERQQQMQAELESLLASPSSSAAAMQQLLQQARVLGVPAESLAAAEGQLQQRQAAAQQLCWEAARVGSLQQLQDAVKAAEQQVLEVQILRECWALMQARQQEAARGLAAAAADACKAVHDSGGGADGIELVRVLEQLSVQCQQHPSAATQGEQLPSSDSSSSDSARQQATAGALASRPLQALQQQAAFCVKLGLQHSVAAAARAVMHACRMLQLTGAWVLTCWSGTHS